MTSQAALPLAGAPDQAKAPPVQVPLARMVACAERELAMRQGAYPRWVRENRMSEAASLEEIAAMDAIVRTLKLFARFEQPIRSTLRACLSADKQDDADQDGTRPRDA